MELNEQIINSFSSKEYKKHRKEIKQYYYLQRQKILEEKEKEFQSLLNDSFQNFKHKDRWYLANCKKNEKNIFLLYSKKYKKRYILNSLRKLHKCLKELNLQLRDFKPIIY